MKKFTKVLSWVIIVAIAIFLIGTAYDYYRTPLITFLGVEEGDELIKNGDKVYIIRKNEYERGDVVITNDVNWRDKKKYQVSRRIVGLPGEYIEHGGVSLRDDQYAVRTSVTNKELTSIYRDAIPEANIYGVVIGDPLTDFESRFDYFINRTKYIPEYIKLKWNNSFLSLKKVGTEIPVISRTIAVVNRNEEGFVVEYTVGAGDSVWKIIENEFLLRDDSKTEKEAIIEVDRIKDELKILPSDELERLGFSSGDIGILMSGDKIKILQIMERYKN